MNKPTLKEQAHGEIEKIFRILLPQNGLAVREEQITLCHAMLDTLLKNNIALCDAGVGIGKTYAYLTACILLKKVCPAWTCRFSAGGDFYLQRCLTGLYHRRIHSVFIPDFSGEPCYLQTHPGNRKKRKRAFCL